MRLINLKPVCEFMDYIFRRDILKTGGARKETTIISESCRHLRHRLEDLAFIVVAVVSTRLTMPRALRNTIDNSVSRIADAFRAGTAQDGHDLGESDSRRQMQPKGVYSDPGG